MKADFKDRNDEATPRTSCAEWRGDSVVVRVRVQPRASRNEVVGVENDRLKIRTTAAPADGKANVAVTKLLADFFHVPKSRIKLITGVRARNKRFSVAAPAVIPVALDVTAARVFLDGKRQATSGY